jgi:hypothetical protein
MVNEGVIKKNWIGVYTGILLLVGLSWLRFGLVHHLKVDNTPFPHVWNYPVFIVYMLALVLIGINYFKIIKKSSTSKKKYRKEAYSIVILASFMLPFLSNDVFVYLGHGYLSNHGIDVFSHTHILKDSIWIHYIDAWPDGPFVYGPINLIPAKIACWIGGENIWGTLLAYKLLMLLFGIGIVEVLMGLIHDPKDLLIAVIAPAFWLHNVGHMHNDMIAALFVSLSVLLILKNHLIAASLFMGIALACKVSVIIYVPFIFCFFFFTFQMVTGKKLLVMLVAFITLVASVVGCYAIFYTGPDSLKVPFGYLAKQNAAKSFAEILGEILNVLFSKSENSIENEFSKESIVKQDPKVYWWGVAQMIFNIIGILMMLITSLIFAIKTKLKFNRELTIEFFIKISFIFFFIYLHIFQAWYLILLFPLILITENQRIKKYFMVLCVYSGVHTIIYVIARPSFLFYLVPVLVIINCGLFLWQFKKNYLTVEALQTTH